MDEIVKNLLEWLGTCPHKHTPAGWGYADIGNFFKSNTSLTKDDVFFAGGGVRYRFEYLFSMLVPAEKAKIINIILRDFPQGKDYPYRTDDLKKYFIGFVKNISKTEDENTLDFHKRRLSISDLGSVDDLRRQYKSLVQKYHPDKVATMGPEIKELAEKKTQEINESFECLVKKLTGCGDR